MHHHVRLVAKVHLHECHEVEEGPRLKMFASGWHTGPLHIVSKQGQSIVCCFIDILLLFHIDKYRYHTFANKIYTDFERFSIHMIIKGHYILWTIW